jgi:hypothetical protein
VLLVGRDWTPIDTQQPTSTQLQQRSSTVRPQEREQALARLKVLDKHRPAPAVAAAIAAAKKDRRWDLTEGCTSATIPTSREFCQGVDRLNEEHEAAAAAEVLGQKIEKLTSSIDQVRRQGAGQIADPQSFGLALLFGLEQNLTALVARLEALESRADVRAA